MADELYRSYSLEKSKNDDGEIITSGSMTIWEDTPDFPLRIGEHFRPVNSSPLLTVDKLSVKDNVVGTLNGKPVRQWQITIEGKNSEQDGSQTENNVKYTFTIADNKKSGTMEVVNTGASPSLRLEVGDTFSVPGIGNVRCTKITGNDEYTDSGTRKWTTVYEWTDGNGESDTKYNFSIERSGDNTISTGSKTVTNSGNSPSNVALAETITVPGVGELPCVKVSGSDDYNDDGSHVWTVTYEGSNAPDTTQVAHDTKYNFSIEKNENNQTVTSGTKTITNIGNTPSSVALAETVNLPGVGDIPMVKVSASDDYDDNGSHVWTVTYDVSNAPDTTHVEHDTKYSISIEKKESNQPITSGSKTVINSGDTPSNLVLDENLNLPGVGDIPLVKVSASDDYDNDGTRKWTVTYDASNAPTTTQTEHDTKYNISIERNSDNQPITSGSKTVINSGDTPSNLVLAENLNLPGVGDIPLVKVSASDDYDDNGNHVWTVTHEGSNEPEITQEIHDTRYNYSIEKNANDEPIATGTKTVTNSGDTPSNVVLSNTINLPGVGDVRCTRVSASDDYNDDGSHVWTVTYDGTNEPIPNEQEQTAHNTKYSISIEKNDNNELVTSGSKTVTNSGDTPSDLEFAENLSLPGVGNIPLVKVSASDDYDDDGTRKWTVTHEGSNAPTPAEQEGHDTKYSLSIERNGNDEPIITGSKTVTNSGDTPSNLALIETVNLPGIGDIKCTKVSANDSYDDDGTHTWTVTYDATNASDPETPAEHDTKYNFSIERNSNNDTITTGSKTVTNSGNTPSSTTLPDKLNLPGIGDIDCVKISGNDAYDDNGTRKWIVTYDGSDAPNTTPAEHDTKYNFSVERNSDNQAITTGSKVVTNSGNTPSSVTLPAKLNLPSIGDIDCVKISGNDDYDDDGTRKWTVTYEGSNAPRVTSSNHDTKYNFSIEKNSDNQTVITGSKTVTNSGSSPSSTTLPEKLNLPSIGDINCVKLSGNDDYDDDGTRKWTVTYEGSNASTATQETHDTKYNFSIERNGDNDTIITGSKTVTNSGSSPSSATLPANVNLPGIGNIKCVKVSGSDDYDDDGSHIWTVTYDGSNAPVTTQTEHDTKYNFSIENSNNEVVKTGSKTVIISGNTLPNLSVGETINVPGIGNVKCVKVSGNDDYDDDGTRKWTVVYDCTDAPQEQTTSSNIRYSINIERNSDGVVVYTGTKEITSSTEPTTTTNIGDKLTFPLIGSVPCVRIYSNNNDNGTWTLTIECSREGESGSGEDGGEGGTSTLLPETEVETTYEINGTTARSVAGELIILKRSDNSIAKKTLIVYTQDNNTLASPGSNYDIGTCISEHISKETIKNNGVVVSSYYKHVIEVEA